MQIKKIIFVLTGIIFYSLAAAQQSDLTKNLRQNIPRNRIAAITNPVYVLAAEAEIDGDTWILKVVINSQARVHSLNLLNSHEAVNDNLGNTAFAAVWWPLANTVVMYQRQYDCNSYTFEPCRGLINASLKSLLKIIYMDNGQIGLPF